MSMTSNEEDRFATAEEAAPATRLTVSTREQALQQAQAEGLVLRRADNTTGYHGVYIDPSCKSRPFQTQVTPTLTLTLTLTLNLTLILTLILTLTQTPPTHYPNSPNPNPNPDPNPKVKRGGKTVYLGSFASAEEAALCVARSPLVRKANARPGHMTGGQALQQAQSEGLALLMAENGTGFHGVSHSKPGRTKPFQATQVRVSK